MHHTKPAIDLDNEEGQWDEVAPASLTFSWDQDTLLFAHEEETGGNSADLAVTIRLMGYQEVNNPLTTSGKVHH